MLLKRFGLILFFVVLLYPVLAVANPKMVSPQSRIEIEKPVIEGEILKGQFEIRNEGDTDLIIEKVTPG